MEPIGIIRTCFTEKFGVPRQAGMISEAKGVIKLKPDPRFKDALRSLEQYSHIWVIFLFDQNADPSEWRPLTTPPRLDVTGRVGVFASRSPYRPNPIGMSAVRLEKILWSTGAVRESSGGGGGIEIIVSGVDILDQTQILDIKPYVPYVDCIRDAKGAWTETEIPKYEVIFSDAALSVIEKEAYNILKKHYVDFQNLLQQTLELDPRPTSQRAAFSILDPKNNGMQFAVRLLGFDILWRIENQKIFVYQIAELG